MLDLARQAEEYMEVMQCEQMGGGNGGSSQVSSYSDMVLPACILCNLLLGAVYMLIRKNKFKVKTN